MRGAYAVGDFDLLAVDGKMLTLTKAGGHYPALLNANEFTAAVQAFMVDGSKTA